MINFQTYVYRTFQIELSPKHVFECISREISLDSVLSAFKEFDLCVISYRNVSIYERNLIKVVTAVL